MMMNVRNIQDYGENEQRERRAEEHLVLKATTCKVLPFCVFLTILMNPMPETLAPCLSFTQKQHRKKQVKQKETCVGKSRSLSLSLQSNLP